VFVVYKVATATLFANSIAYYKHPLVKGKNPFSITLKSGKPKLYPLRYLAKRIVSVAFMMHFLSKV